MLVILFVLGVMYDYRAPLENKVDPRCYLNDHIRAWVYFTDKGIGTDRYDNAIRAVRKQISEASRERRAVRQGVTDYADIPLYEDYVNEVEARGGLLVTQSKWLNAASFIVARDDIDQIAQLDFVHKIVKVAPFRAPQEAAVAVEDTAVYGLTYRQSQMFGIDRVHEMGIFGSDVRVGFLDTGFRRTPLAVANINVLAEHDFLEGDQVFFENIPVADRYGIYSDIAFHQTSPPRYNLFLAGDTVRFSSPVRDLMYTYTSDLGTPWSTPIKLANVGFGNWVREIDVCGRDTMFLFYRDRYGLKYLIYSDTLLVQPMPLTGLGRREPSAVQIGDTVYVTYHSKGSDRTYLMLNQVTISGFASEIAIDSSFSSIKAPEAINGGSEIGIFYHITPEDTLYFVRTYGAPDSFTQTFKTLGKDAQAVTLGDTIFLIWKDASNDPLFRVAFAKSADFGTSFDPPTFISDDVNSIGKISIAKDAEQVSVAWETAGKIYYRNSYDNGFTFGSTDSLNRQFAYLPTLGTSNAGILKFYVTRGDSLTDGYSPTDPDYYYPRHGTEMLGLVGGYFSGRYIGVAPGAQFIVAKTENPDSAYEYPVEEDTYIAGLEWCESMGADIVSSSLGYSEWYSWPDDFDGRTSPASVAAYEATKRGVLVVTATGNVYVPRLEIPGDAMDVITVGGIDSVYNRWQYSGYGPTYDGRLKPEIMCLSAAPVVVNPDSSDSYLYSFGTSGATAMMTGICALLLEGHPNWNVDSVRNALFSTASFAGVPSDSMGYGWPDAYAAINFSPLQVEPVTGSAWLTPYPNPFVLTQHDNIYVPFKLDRESAVEIKVYSMSGRLVKQEERPSILLPGRYTARNPSAYNVAFMWDGTDIDGNEVNSGMYYCVLITHGAGNDVVKIAVVR
ncbi:hypothetical protein AMJ83_03700 [candidate division WOR_3 bacterium SM23_42]|uniref:Peptidase S8/S53 domain-containing protein n=1 Tax=candidate division WOR_3 bacterium SM23_42 TaxID=1703779 RepID=A0A0S8FUZ4_UNCW3|nr:MAG: hypothetical protein AMJ83_03700 [candidate division WOR_3 bacterium SM23_42]